MTANLKTAFKLLKYGFQLKTNCASAIIITVIGTLLVLAAHDATLFIMGAFYLALGPMCILQIQMTLLYSNIAKSSPKARMLEVQTCDCLSTIMMLVCYTFISIYTIIRHQTSPEKFSPWYPLATGVMFAVLLIYFCVCYKLYFVGIFILMPCTIFVFGFLTFLVETTLFKITTIPIGASCILGYVCIFIGLLLAGLLRRWLYKLPLSKMAGGSKLRKQL